MDKILVNIFVPALDKDFDLELPINLEMKYVLDEIQKSLYELSDNSYVISDNVKLYDKNTGRLINLNNIVKYSGLTNGCSVLLINLEK